MGSRLIIRRGEQPWLIEDSHGTDHGRRYVITCSLHRTEPPSHRIRWCSQGSAGPSPDPGPPVRGSHLRAVFDSKSQQWTLWSSVFECQLPQAPAPDFIPLDLAVEESQAQDCSDLLEPVEAAPWAALLPPKALGTLWGKAPGTWLEDPFEGFGVVWIAKPWFEVFSSASASLTLAIQKAQEILIQRGEKKALGFLFLSAAGLDHGSVVSTRSQWCDGPLGVIKGRGLDLQWLAYMPPGGIAALELELPLALLEEDQNEETSLSPLERGPIPHSLEFWEGVHRILIGRVMDTVVRLFFSPPQMSVGHSIPRNRSGDQGPSIDERESSATIEEEFGNLWISVPLKREVAPQAVLCGDFFEEDLKKALLVLLLCQIFRESVPILVSDIDKSDLTKGWKTFFHHMGAHFLGHKDLGILRQKRQEKDLEKGLSSMIDVEALRDVFEACPGFPWDDRRFLRMWVGYLNRQVEIIPPCFLPSEDKT